MKKKKPTHGFEVPPGYFDKIGDRMDSLMDEARFPEGTGYSTPDSYFDQLEDRVLEAWKKEERSEKVISLYKRRSVQWISGIAAAILISVMVINPQQADINSNLNTLTSSDMEEYLIQQMEWDVYDLGMLIGTEEANELPDSEIFSTDELENYLIEQLDDNTLLIE